MTTMQLNLIDKTDFDNFIEAQGTPRHKITQTTK